MPAETSLKPQTHSKPLTGVTTIFCCPVLRQVFQSREVKLCLGRCWAASWERSALVLHCCPSAQLPAPARTGVLHQRALGLTRSRQICVPNKHPWAIPWERGSVLLRYDLQTPHSMEAIPAPRTVDETHLGMCV